jgi:hypothetical protein
MPDAQTVIKLSVTKTLQSEVSPERGGNMLKIEVTEGVNIDPKIFVFQVDVGSEFSPEQLSLFYSVASVAQLSTLPADAGNVDEPFFRLAILEAMFETPSELETFLQKILGEIRNLQRANDIFLDPASSETTNYEVNGGTITVVP